MASAMARTLDEAYERLHVTGPEFEGYLSNHGPMVVEAMVRRGHGDLVGNWLDVYVRRLDEFPRGMGPIGARTAWPTRITPWVAAATTLR
jgi:hypothetical protein